MSLRWTLLHICLSVLLLQASAGRWDVPIPERSGRQLLDISFNATGANANSTVQVFALSTFNSTSPCIFQGYPGSRADLIVFRAVPGPLVINVPVGSSSQINFGSLSNGAIVALYNQTANNTLTTSYNGSYGLISTTFKANDSSRIGQTAYISAGRVDKYNNSDPQHSWNSQPSCLVNVTFVVAPYNPPPPLPAATLAPTPSPSPGAAGGWLGGVQLPKNPCYCTAVVGGRTTCFNFNQAGSDINCAPNSSYKCSSLEAPAGLYTQQAGPVYDCTVPTLETAG